VRINDARGMMAFWTDITEAYILRFQEWHNCEHMIERTSIPGFMVGRRYRGMGNAPMFFISYETTEAAVFKSQPYLDRINNPTPWTKEALTHFNNNMRNIYRLVAASGEQAPSEAPYCLAARFNIRPGAETETIHWYWKDCLPAMNAVDGVFRARLFEVDEAISNIQTAERAIYGGGPGQQKYLVYCEMIRPEVAESPEFMAVRRGEGDPEMFKNLENVFEELSWLEFAMYNPDYMGGC
jgi:hypothetical protein